LSIYKEENFFNEGKLFEISETLRDFNSAAGDSYPTLNKSDSTQQTHQFGELKIAETREKTQ
jgi:hypothetical protein